MKRKHLTLSPLGASISLASTYFYYSALPVLGTAAYLVLPLLAILHIAVLYLLASKYSHTHLGECMRGAMIGINTGWNALLIGFITGNFYLGAIVSFPLLLSSFLSISRKPFYHVLISWLNWILPMSLCVNLPGLLIFIVNVVFAPLGYLHPLLYGIRVRFMWNPYCSTLCLNGGLIRPMKGFAGLNMGNFIFINPGWQHLLKHETGHLFSLAAMGSIFHYIGGIDESFLQKHYWKAFAEYLAESYNSSEDSVLSMWS